MADPISIIGTAGAIANIIDVVAKTVSTLHKLHEQWKQADFTLVNLMSQLTAFRAGLDKIQEWANDDMVEPHHQLVMDLEVVISCCRMLLTKLQSDVAELNQDSNDKLNFESKMKLMVKNGTLEGLQRMVERQTIALTLLLTACNCKAITEQKTLLEQKSSRKIFSRVRDDSSSLYVQRDSASFYSRWTGTASSLSKISRVFDFDRELFISKVYERALQSSLKNTVESIRRQKFDITLPHVMTTDEERKRSQMIDKQLEEDSRRLKREVKVLLLGDQESKSAVVRQMKVIHQNGYSVDERALYVPTVQKNVLEIMKIMVSIAQSAEANLDETAKMHAEVLSKEVGNSGPNDVAAAEIIITAEAATAAQGLWASEAFQTALLESTDIYVPEYSGYFIDEVHRITKEGYLPREADIIRTRTKTTGISETRFTMGSLSIHMFDIAGQRSERKKWIHSFENVTSIIFCVDLASYDQLLLENYDQNRMMESLLLFDSVVNSRWFLRTSVILFLCNVDRFRQKLALRPLSNYFPDYSGGNDVNKAAKYILWRFNQVNRANLNLYPHLVNTEDVSNIRLVFAAVKETLLQNALR